MLEHRFDRQTATALEVGTVALAFFVVCAFDNNERGVAFIIPVVFALVILVFSFQRGWVSDVLMTRPFVSIGTLSYSIYMVHALVFYCFSTLVIIVAQQADWISLARFALPDGQAISLLAFFESRWVGDLVILALLGLTIVVATVTYRRIEEPGRLWSREIVARRMAAEEAAATSRSEPKLAPAQ